MPIAGALCQLLICADFSFSAVAYTHVRLQVPANRIFFDARDLAEDGRAGGYVRISNDSDPIDVPTVWNPVGQNTVLPVKGPYRQGYVNGFQTSGTPLGLVRTATVFPPPAGFWTSTGFTSLPDFGQGGSAVCGSEDIIGGETYVLESNQTFTGRATLWTSTSVTRVTGIGDFASRVEKINASGIYVGLTKVQTDLTTLRDGGFIGQNGTGAVMSFPGVQVVRANDINDNNRVIGLWTPGDGTVRGFVSTAFQDDFQDLGLFPGVPSLLTQGINNQGTIVGAALTNTGVRALIWNPGDTQPTDLNTLVNIPDETLVEAMDINNAGQILARGFNGYYIFTPIPEPTAVAIILAFGFYRRQRR